MKNLSLKLKIEMTKLNKMFPNERKMYQWKLDKRTIGKNESVEID